MSARTKYMLIGAVATALVLKFGGTLPGVANVKQFVMS